MIMESRAFTLSPIQVTPPGKGLKATKTQRILAKTSRAAILPRAGDKSMLDSMTESFDEQLPKIRAYPKIQSPNFRVTKAHQLRQAFDVRNFIDDAELEKKI